MLGPVLMACTTIAIAAPPKGAPFARWLRLPEPMVLLADVVKAPPAKPAEKPAEKVPEKAVEKASAKPDEAAALMDRVQRFYEKTNDFTADFEQLYRYVALGRTQKSSGTVQVKKPGFMRWDYVKPHPKQFILDGKDLYLYEPDDNTVMVKRGFSSDSLSAAVTFLFGKGKLADEFAGTRVDRPEYGPVVLALEPKKPQGGFSKLFFVVDEATGQVKTSVVIDAQGNENRITFQNVKANAGIDAARFKFETPRGATVQVWK